LDVEKAKTNSKKSHDCIPLVLHLYQAPGLPKLKFRPPKKINTKKLGWGS